MYVATGQVAPTATTYRAPTTTVSVAQRTPVYCVTAAEKQDAALRCRQSMVHGLGQAGTAAYPAGHKFYGIDPCSVEKLPICVALLPALKPVAPAPVYTTGVTAAPKLTLTQIPRLKLPTPVAPTPVAPPEERMSLATVGLLAVVVLGGGYLIYRQTKKSKAA